MTTAPCKNCGAPVYYSPDDVVYLHVERRWGKRWSPQSAADGTFDNRYFCDAEHTTSAEPDK